MKIQDILKQNSIDFVTEGNNVVEGNINIECPFCRKSRNPDPSKHLGIGLKHPYPYACWRNRRHKGRDASFLLKELLNISLIEAKDLLQNQQIFISNQGVYDQVVNLFSKQKDATTKWSTIPWNKEIEFPEEFIEVRKTGATSKFFKYIKQRGFLEDEKLEKFIKDYDIRCCLTGEWANRLIFPCYVDNKLVTWTSRVIDDRMKLKHRDAPIEKSIKYMKQIFYNYDKALEGGKCLFIVEGIFDCLKLSYYLPKEYKVISVTTNKLIDYQINYLMKIAYSFKKIIVMLDKDAFLNSIEFSISLGFIGNFEFMEVPFGLKDPGELNEEQILSLVK